MFFTRKNLLAIAVEIASVAAASVDGRARKKRSRRTRFQKGEAMQAATCAGLGIVKRKIPAGIGRLRGELRGIAILRSLDAILAHFVNEGPRRNIQNSRSILAIAAGQFQRANDGLPLGLLFQTAHQRLQVSSFH